MAANGNRRPPAESRWDSDGSVSPHPPDLPDPVLSVTHILSPQRFLRLHFTCVVLMALVRGPCAIIPLRLVSLRSSGATCPSNSCGLLLLLHGFLLKKDKYHKAVMTPELD